ncbi:MafI family immunity protein [Agromyces sp. MMS24-JH15]|uniref:MafI family immunity protein n=1 Tax=Agromyces sp. MMS24-JH15 TaxID=3243765 RepID=UPI00374A15C8
MNQDLIEQAIRDALDGVRDILGTADVENAEVFLDHAEPAIALELICDQLYEYDLSIPRHSFERLKWAGERMNVDPDRWLRLSLAPSLRRVASKPPSATNKA